MQKRHIRTKITKETELEENKIFWEELKNNIIYSEIQISELEKEIQQSRASTSDIRSAVDEAENALAQVAADNMVRWQEIWGFPGRSFPIDESSGSYVYQGEYYERQLVDLEKHREHCSNKV